MRGDHLGPEQVISFAGIRKQRMDGAFFSERIIQCLDELGLEPGVTLTNFWQTFETPAPYDGPEESLEGPLVLKPPVNGTVFRFVTFEPEDPAVLAKLDGKAAFAEMGAADRIQENTRHPFMHRTNSVDYAVIVSGKITMLMDEKEDDVVLSAGDVVVQRGTNHAWSNQFDEPCVIAFVLVDGYGEINR